MSFPLLMTASVNPRGMSGLSVNSIAEREGQYLGTLQFYLRNDAIAQIVFIENSGHDLAAFRALAAEYPQKRVEFISCDLNGYPREWQELRRTLTLDYASEHSQFVAEAGGFQRRTFHPQHWEAAYGGAEVNSGNSLVTTRTTPSTTG